MSVWIFLVTFMAGSLVVEATVRDFPDEMTCQMYGQVFVAQTMATGGMVAAAERVEERSS